MRNASRLGWMATALLATACGGARTPADVPTPAVHELARLQDAGQLDQSRLACAAVALAPAVDELRQRLPELRAAEAQLHAGVAGDHARSVQSGMAASDVMDRATLNARSMHRSAEAATAEGDFTRAAQYASWAIGLLNRAREWTDIRVHSGDSVVPWTGEEMDLLAEYASLRATLATTAEPSPVTRARVQQIERDDPKLMDEYAGLLLSAYEDPDLECPPPGV